MIKLGDATHLEERLAQGRENAKAALRRDPATLREIENVVREAHGLSAPPPRKAEPASNKAAA